MQKIGLNPTKHLTSTLHKTYFFGTSGLRDFGTSGLRDFGTSGLRDFGTSGLRDFGTSARSCAFISNKFLFFLENSFGVFTSFRRLYFERSIFAFVKNCFKYNFNFAEKRQKGGVLWKVKEKHVE